MQIRNTYEKTKMVPECIKDALCVRYRASKSPWRLSFKWINGWMKQFFLLIICTIFIVVYSNLALAFGGEKVLVLGVRNDAPPFSSCDKKNKIKCQGYTISLCEAIAKRAIYEGIACAYTYKEVSAATRFTSLQEGSIDMLCGASTVTLERLRVVDFSLFTFLSGISVMYDNSLSYSTYDQKEAIPIGILENTTTEESIGKIWDEIRSELGYLDQKFSTVFVQTHYEGLEALSDGKINAYIADREILLALQKSVSRQRPELIVSKQYFTIEPYAIGLRLGDTTLRYVTNTVLSELFDRNLSRDGEMGVISLLKEYFPGSKFSKSLLDMYANQRLNQGSRIAPPLNKMECQGAPK